MTRFKCTGCLETFGEKGEAEECAAGHSGLARVRRIYSNRGPPTEATSLFDYEKSG